MLFLERVNAEEGTLALTISKTGGDSRIPPSYAILNSNHKGVETMMQGDSYSLAIEVTRANGNLVTDADVTNIEITIGNLRKTIEDGVVYDSGSGAWKFPLSQEESFQMPRRVKGQVRLLWTNGEVEGVSLGDISIDESISREVL